MEVIEIETPVDSMDSSLVFHVVKDVLGFVLYMHQQIPSILQDISTEFDALHTEYKELEVVPTQNEVSSSRRKRLGRMREVKQGIRKLQKFMDAFSGLQTSLQVMLSEVPDVQGIILVLGASPIRPQHVFELQFSHGRVVPGGACNFLKSRAAEGLSRKVIRALISKGVGSASYTGPSKLFLLVRASSSFNLPLHFLPKRDFRYSKKGATYSLYQVERELEIGASCYKSEIPSLIESSESSDSFHKEIIPFRMQLKCRARKQEMDTPHHDFQTASISSNSTDSTSDDLIWFQCRHVIKGLASKTPSMEE